MAIPKQEEPSDNIQVEQTDEISNDIVASALSDSDQTIRLNLEEPVAEEYGTGEEPVADPVNGTTENNVPASSIK